MPATMEDLRAVPVGGVIVITDSTTTRRWTREDDDNFSEVDGSGSLPLRFFEGSVNAGRLSIDGGTGEAAVARDPRPVAGELRPDDAIEPGEVLTYEHTTGAEPAAYYVLEVTGEGASANCDVLYRQSPEEDWQQMSAQPLGRYVNEGRPARWRRYSLDQAEHFFPEVSKALALRGLFTKDLSAMTRQMADHANTVGDEALMRVIATHLGLALHSTPVKISARMPMTKVTVEPTSIGVPGDATIGFVAEGYVDFTFAANVLKVGTGCQCGLVGRTDAVKRLPANARYVSLELGRCPSSGTSVSF